MLYASIFEAIGLRPILFRVPGHIFVGWHALPSEGASPAGDDSYFLETTSTHDATFEEALDKAALLVKMFKPIDLKPIAHRGPPGGALSPDSPMFEKIRASVARIEVSSLREAGFLPQPYE